MDLEERLDQYEVTAVPKQGGLHLFWSLPAQATRDEVEVKDDAGSIESGRDATAALAILSDYRITRVPSRAAS